MLKSKNARDISAFLEKSFPEFSDDKIIVSVDSTFIYDSLEQADARMKAVINEFFQGIEIELKLDENINANKYNFNEIQSINKYDEEDSSKQKLKKQDMKNLHPVEILLVNELKAKFVG